MKRSPVSLCTMGSKMVQILLKLKLIYNRSYFEAYLQRLSLVQSGDRRTLLWLRLIQRNFGVCIVRLFVYRHLQEKVSPEVNGLLYNVFAIEGLPANVNLAIVSFLLNGIHFQRLLYVENDGITSTVARIVFQQQDDGRLLTHNYSSKKKGNTVFGKIILKLLQKVGAVQRSDKAAVFTNPRLQNIQLFNALIIALKNIFQTLFLFMS